MSLRVSAAGLGRALLLTEDQKECKGKTDRWKMGAIEQIHWIDM